MVNLTRMRMLIGYERRLKLKYQKKLSDATRITSQLTGMPRGSGNHSQTEEGAIELAEVTEAYREVFESLNAQRAELQQLLPALDNPDDIAIMRLRYMDGYNVQDIPYLIHLSERAMFYHLASAEKKLAQMFPEKVSLQ